MNLNLIHIFLVKPKSDLKKSLTLKRCVSFKAVGQLETSQYTDPLLEMKQVKLIFNNI